MRRIGLILLTLLSVWSAVSAQDDGQLCVRSFEDRNANGRLDAGEPLLTRGIGVNLLDTGGVTIASALLDQSPTAAQGVVCFQFLAAGQYSVVITSPDYNMPDPIITSVATGGLPTVVEFAGQRAGVEAAPTPVVEETLPDDNSVRVLVAALAALLVVLGMIVLGVLVYLFAFRTRRERTPVTLDPRRTTTTGSIPVVRAGDTGETPKV